MATKCIDTGKRSAPNMQKTIIQTNTDQVPWHHKMSLGYNELRNRPFIYQLFKKKRTRLQKVLSIFNNDTQDGYIGMCSVFYYCFGPLSFQEYESDQQISYYTHEYHYFLQKCKNLSSIFYTIVMIYEMSHIYKYFQISW